MRSTYTTWYVCTLFTTYYVLIDNDAINVKRYVTCPMDVVDDQFHTVYILTTFG